MSDGADMSFMGHLEALRSHLMRSVIAVLVCAIGVFLAKDFVFGEVLFGPLNDHFLSYRFLCWLSEATGAGDTLCVKSAFKGTLQLIGVGEAFFMHFQISFILGFVLAFPYIVFEIWKFIQPGLYPTEQKKTRGVVLICTLLFLTGMSFGYFIIAPFSLNFLLNYSIPGTTQIPTAESYMSFMVMFTLPIGLIFEMPVLIHYMSKLGLITHRFMQEYRRHALVVILVIAAFVTPSPDIVSQLIVAVPLWFLYELSIGVARRNTLKAEKEAL